MSDDGIEFAQCAERGLTSSFFNVVSNIRDGDQRVLNGTPVEDIMSMYNVDFDSARLMLVQAQMAEAGIDPETGFPKDNRSVTSLSSFRELNFQNAKSTLYNMGFVDETLIDSALRHTQCDLEGAVIWILEKQIEAKDVEFAKSLQGNQENDSSVSTAPSSSSSSSLPLTETDVTIVHDSQNQFNRKLGTSEPTSFSTEDDAGFAKALQAQFDREDEMERQQCARSFNGQPLNYQRNDHITSTEQYCRSQQHDQLSRRFHPMIVQSQSHASLSNQNIERFTRDDSSAIASAIPCTFANNDIMGALDADLDHVTNLNVTPLIPLPSQKP